MLGVYRYCPVYGASGHYISKNRFRLFAWGRFAPQLVEEGKTSSRFCLRATITERRVEKPKKAFVGNQSCRLSRYRAHNES